MANGGNCRTYDVGEFELKGSELVTGTSMRDGKDMRVVYALFRAQRFQK